METANFSGIFVTDKCVIPESDKHEDTVTNKMKNDGRLDACKRDQLTAYHDDFLLSFASISDQKKAFWFLFPITVSLDYHNTALAFH